MINYSLALLLILIAIRRRAPRVLFEGGLAILLGAGLAAFYLVPATYEQRWVDISQVVAEGVRPQDNFLFTRIDDPRHNQFNLLVSVLALAEMAGLAVAGGLPPPLAPRNTAGVLAPGRRGPRCPRFCCFLSLRRCGIIFPSFASCSFPGAGCCVSTWLSLC